MTDAEIFEALSPEDRDEVASPCFSNGRFRLSGELSCCHGTYKIGLPVCLEELMCEMLAAEITMPSNFFLRDYWMGHDVKTLAAIYQIEEWAVRFQIILKEVDQ